MTGAACMLGLVTLLGAAPAPGAPPAKDGRAAAKGYNARAIEAFKAQDYRTALADFQRAYELNPDPKLRLNMALANENLARLDEARLDYEAYLLTEAKGKKSEAAREKLRALEERMKKSGKIILIVDPPPDSLVFDGTAVAEHPARIWTGAGTHHLVVEKQGYLREEREVEVAPGARAELSVHLQPLAPPPTPKSARDPAAGAGASRGPLPVKKVGAAGVGAVGLGLGALATLAVLGGSATAGGIYFTFTMIPGFARFQMPMQVGLILGVVLAVVSVPAMLLGLATGGVGLPVSVVVE